MKLEGTALVKQGEDHYYRPAGIWTVRCERINGILVAAELVERPSELWCKGKELIECTEVEFREDNAGYV